MANYYYLYHYDLQLITTSYKKTATNYKQTNDWEQAKPLTTNYRLQQPTTNYWLLATHY